MMCKRGSYQGRDRNHFVVQRLALSTSQQRNVPLRERVIVRGFVGRIDHLGVLVVVAW